MKKIMIMAAVAAAFVAVSCSKEQNNDVQQPVEAKQITISATIPGDFSKVALEYTGDALELTWSVGDVIRVADHTNPSTYSDFTLASGDGTKNATFTGTEISASSYDVTLQTTNWPANLLAQVQSEDESTAHLGYSMTLSGVNTYEDISFNSAWASSNGGGSFTQSGALHLCAILPDEVVEKVNMVTIVADQPIFGGGIGTMTIALTTPADNNNTNNLDVFASIPASGVTIPANTGLLFKFGTTDASHSVYTRYYKVSSTPLILAGGQVNKIYLTADNADKYAGKADEGTEEKPFLIGDKYQLVYLMNLYKAAETAKSSVKYYVRLVDDIDLAGVDWIPFNRTGSYGRAIDFDGNNHTISNLTVGNSYAYPSFAGVVNGSIKNVTFESPVINGGNNNIGVVGGYIGTTDIVATCSGITINKAIVTAVATSTKRNVGVFGGIVGGAGSSITDCHVTGATTVSQTTTQTPNSVAGFIGNVNVACTISNCTVTADVTNTGSYYTAGFVGQIGSAVAAQFTSCAYLGGTITGTRSNNNSPVAGFVGRVPNNSGASFQNCYVDGANIVAASCGRSGGFIGDAGGAGAPTVTSCYVINSTISGGINTGGFSGTYGVFSKCYVDNTTITANAIQTGGFVGYPENSTITNCYVSPTVVISGGAINNVGGFIGICKGGATVTDCYEAAALTGSGSGVGGFIGYVDTAPTSITKCIAWTGFSFYGALKSGVDDSVITNNYTGTTGTISSQATTLGWDGSIWNLTDSVPTLK